jgi:hypothetical protein
MDPRQEMALCQVTQRWSEPSVERTSPSSWSCSFSAMVFDSLPVDRPLDVDGADGSRLTESPMLGPVRAGSRAQSECPGPGVRPSEAASRPKPERRPPAAHWDRSETRSGGGHVLQSPVGADLEHVQNVRGRLPRGPAPCASEAAAGWRREAEKPHGPSTRTGPGGSCRPLRGQCCPPGLGRGQLQGPSRTRGQRSPLFWAIRTTAPTSSAFPAAVLPSGIWSVSSRPTRTSHRPSKAYSMTLQVAMP